MYIIIYMYIYIWNVVNSELMFRLCFARVACQLVSHVDVVFSFYRAFIYIYIYIYTKIDPNSTPNYSSVFLLSYKHDISIQRIQLSNIYHKIHEFL